MADYVQPPFVDKRLRFFDGQFLKDQDFIDEQKYHVDRLRRYSRFLNVSGIVDGLTVEASPNLVTVAPGTALDNQGRQVVLGKQVTVALQDYKGSLVDLVIAYNEEASDPQAGGGEATRFYERPYVGPRDKAPNKAADAIVLAQLRIDGNGTVAVDNTPRVASGLRLPDGRTQDHNAWPALRVANGAVALTGDLSVTGHLRLGPSSALAFANQTRQMINLWGLEYGIGIQNYTHYYRTYKNFAWYKGGSHHDDELNPGGGTVQLVINDGNVGIGITPPSKRLHVEAGELRVRASHNNTTADIGAFLAQNLTQGIGIGYNRLEAIGSTANQDILILPKGTGSVAIGGPLSVAGTLSVTGASTLTGSVGLGPASALSFANQTRQMINLWGDEYGIGIQGSTQYYRTYKNFAWYKGGSHHNDELNPGGGTVQLVINDGNVGIGIAPPAKRLHVEAGELRVRASHNNTTADIGAFLAQNLTQGIGIGYNRLEAIGSTANQDILILPKGTGSVAIGGALSVAGLLVVSGLATVGATLAVGGRIHTSMWNIEVLFDRLAGPLPKQVSFTTQGGPFVIFVSGSAFRSAAGMMSLTITVERTDRIIYKVDSYIDEYTNVGGQHAAFPTRVLFFGGAGAGVYTFTIASYANSCLTDLNDRFYATVWELPYQRP